MTHFLRNITVLGDLWLRCEETEWVQGVDSKYFS